MVVITDLNAVERTTDLSPSITKKRPIVGASQLSEYLPLLKNKRVGLVVNQTSVIGHSDLNHTGNSNAQSLHLLDALLLHHVDVARLFAPEHGIRGNHSAGEKISSGQDPVTGIDIISIYGSSKRPHASHINDLDIIVFDIQDVGARFYTYIISMFYMMQAAKAANVEFIVLDRPNPHIAVIDGPMLEKEFSSFVGLLPIPMMHGLTVGELAKMIVGEGWLQNIAPLQSHSALIGEDSFTNETLQLTVIPVLNYDRDTLYSLPIAPSPNLPNHRAIQLYPSLCLFEATPISIGRGTDFPFQVIGHNKISLGDFSFVPESRPLSSKHPKLQDLKVNGQDLREHNDHRDNNNGAVSTIDLSYIINWYQAFKRADMTFFTRADFFDKLAGTDALRKMIIAGKSEQQIRQEWQADLDAYEAKRAAYLLYGEGVVSNKSDAITN